MYINDKRIVATLDAGGTNLVFGALQAANISPNPFPILLRLTTLNCA